MPRRTVRWLIPCLMLVSLSWAMPLTSQEAEAPLSPLSAAELVRLFGSSVVLIRAELPADQFRLGSGFFLGPGGVIATSLHVLDGAKSVSIRVDGRRFEPTSVRAFDLERDLALLQIDSDEFVPALPGDTSALGRGDTIYVISNPLGLAGTVSEGLLAAWREPGREDEDDLETMVQLGGIASGRLLQISAPVSPGSSGAPVFDEYGYVVGLVAAAVDAGALDLNFAVPIDALTELLDREEGWDLASLQATLHSRRQDLADPHLVDARFHLANEDPVEASRSLDRALGLFPSSGEALTLKGRILLQAGRIDEAEELFRRSVEANPESAEAWENLGLFQLEHGSSRDVHEAVAAFEQALDLDPWRAEAAFGLGIVRARQGRLGEARTMLEQAVESDREHVRAWVVLGVVCVSLDDVDAAEEAFESALWLDESSTQAVCGLADIYAQTRNPRAGEYRRRCESAPSDRR